MSQPAPSLHPLRHRVSWIDRSRGTLLLLAAFDHLSIVLWGPEGWYRWIARPSVVLLAVLAGHLRRGSPGGRRRNLEVFAGGLIATVIASMLGFTVPNVMLVFGVVFFLDTLILRAGIPAWIVFTAAITQALYLPFWDGYQPGLVLALMVVGRLLTPRDLHQWLYWAGRLPVGVVGRFPVTFWIAHLLLLVGLVEWAT